MKYRVLTITAQYGAGGPEIAARIAADLGWKLVDKQLIDHIAELARVPRELAASYDQHVDPWFRRLLKSLWRGGFESVAAHSGDAPFDCEHMAELSRRAMEESAAIGNCVLVGRGGQCILRRREDAFHVFVYAPRQHRLRRVLPEVSSEAEACSRMDRIDQQRLAYIQRYFESDWYDRRLYQIMLNSSLGEEAASAVVTCAMRTAGDRLKV
jgi:cytidylate kinase